MRRSLGTAVFSGMLGVTAFGIFLTPVFFFVIQGTSENSWIANFMRRPAVSAGLGAVLGLVSGWLMGKVEIFPMAWCLAVGPCVGVLAVLAVVGVHRKIKLRTGVDTHAHTNGLSNGLSNGTPGGHP